MILEVYLNTVSIIYKQFNDLLFLVIQSDAITVDKQKTIQGLKEFLENMNLFEQQEESWMKAWKPSIVVLDVSFSPANVAHVNIYILTLPILPSFINVEAWHPFHHHF